MRGLSAAQHAAQRAAALGNIEPFLQAVNEGVSANLCDALLGLAGTDGNAPFEIGLSWSSNRSAPRQIADRIRFAPDVLPFFEEVSRVFKEKSPREEFELEGLVVRMDREEVLGPKAIRIMGAVEGKMRKVEVTLAEDDLHHAIQAFQDINPVRVLGELIRAGQRYVLRNPRHFEVLPVED